MRVCAFCIVSLLSSCLFGCDSLDTGNKNPPTTKAEEKKVPAASVPSDESILKACLVVLNDTRIARSGVVPVTGDLRPLWRISGRVRNNCQRDFTNVMFSVVVVKKESFEDLDSSELTLPGTIQASATRGFVQDVHLRIAEAQWTWYMEPKSGAVGSIHQ